MLKYILMVTFTFCSPAFAEKVIMVNKEKFTLTAYENGNEIFSSKVIIGFSTPNISTQIINVKLNPDWTPPDNLKRKGFRHVKAGPNSPLGKVKFNLQNMGNIAMHDTNQPSLYDRENRNFSHGCIRIKEYRKLLAFIMNIDEIGAIILIENNGTKIIEIPEIVKVIVQWGKHW